VSVEFLNSLVDAIFSAKKGSPSTSSRPSAKGKQSSMLGGYERKKRKRKPKRSKYNKPVDRFARDPNSTAGKLKRDRNTRQRRLDQIEKEMGR